MNVLVTGGAGYLGSVLVPKLLVRGHRVRVLDIGYFGTEHLRLMRPTIEIVREDIRKVLSSSQFAADILHGCDCVIHLAAISNDPSAELNPDLTRSVNAEASLALAERARGRGVRFIFSSSCSVYGSATDVVDELGVTNPLTSYAASKLEAEAGLQQMSDGSWTPTILRNGTLFGYSPRMRFDLVVNIFSLYSMLHGEIGIFGQGGQWRPYLHVRDCARAFVFFAEAEEPRHECYNVAHENLQVTDVADMFRQIVPKAQVTHLGTDGGDDRDYRVSTQRLQDEGFRTGIDVSTGAQEMVEAIASGLIPDPESIYYRNAKWLRELTSLADRDHVEIVGIMETLSHIRRAAT